MFEHLWRFMEAIYLERDSGTPPPGNNGDVNDDEDDDDDEPPGQDNAVAQHWRRMSRKHQKREGNYRTQLRATQAEVARLRGQVLSDDDRAAFEAFKALGKTPAEITAALSASETSATELATLKRDAALRDVAEAAGANVRVLRDRAGDLAFEIRDEKRDDQNVKVVYVKDGDTAKPLREYAEAHWSDYLPVLFPANTGQTGQQSTTATTARETAPIVPFPAQHGGGAATASDPLAAFLEAQNKAAAEAPNPLAPARSA